MSRSTRPLLRAPFVVTVSLLSVACGSRSGGVMGAAGSSASAGAAPSGQGGASAGAAGMSTGGAGMPAAGGGGTSAGAAPTGQGGASAGAAATSTGGAGMTAAGGSASDACPASLPRMGDPCAPLGLECPRNDGGCLGAGSTVICGALGWYIKPVTTGCNPPPPCPMEEPKPGHGCGVSMPGGSPTTDTCRYDLGTCFAYWKCTPGGGLWTTVNDRPDGCCAPAEPSAGATCPVTGATCHYGDDLAVCGAGSGWTIAPATKPSGENLYCPAVAPTMADPCGPDGLACHFSSSPCPTETTCVSGHWWSEQVTDGTCTPAPACPHDEPTNGAACSVSADGKAPSKCRYAHQDCNGYWTCDPSTAAFEPVIGPADACCPQAVPPNGSSCGREGLSCDYGTATATCLAGRWSLSTGP